MGARKMDMDTTETLLGIDDRLKELEHQAELIKTVLMVKEAGAVMAADAFDGLRKQVVASASERRAHLGQLAAMAVAVSRATDVADVRSQVKEWLVQAGIAELWAVPEGYGTSDYFETLDNATGADGPFRVVEPAYVDTQTGRTLRLGRASAGGPSPSSDPTNVDSETGIAPS